MHTIAPTMNRRTPAHLITRLLRRLLYVIGQWSPFHYKADTVAPQADNLEGGRRVFRAPYVVIQEIYAWLTCQPSFLYAMPRGEGQYLIRVAVCGEQLCANVYRVENATLGDAATDYLIDPVFQDDWFNQGLFHFLVDHDRGVTALTREQPGKYYCEHDVLLSYRRQLNVPELLALEKMVVHSR